MVRPVKPLLVPPGSADWQNLNALLDRRSIPITECGCQIWLGACDSSGYGNITYDGMVFSAHRVAYAIWRGAIPDNHLVLHTCDIPPCINPNHLFLGDDAANSADKVSKGRAARVKGTHQGQAKLTEEDAAAILLDPRPMPEIAADYGVSVWPISAIKRGLRWMHVTQGVMDPRGTCRGEKVGSAKLTEGDVRKILKDNRSQRIIGDEFGVHQVTISMIKRRKLWSHVSP